MNVWKTQDGELIPFEEMKTTHLFYAVRLIWNHTAPPHLQLPGGRYDGPQRWPAKKRIEMLKSLISELSKRTDLPFSLDIQLSLMRERSRHFAGQFEVAQESSK